ncbi:MAG: glycosyltransferase [Chitinophagaceae bacterium]|nr:glycosyltransferase [Chitinophagaceae bacterium]
MKVALINDRLNAGGAEKVLVYIANLLYSNGIDVKVIILLDKAALDDQLHANIPIHYLHRTSRFSFKAFFKLKTLLNDVDIAHVHSRYNLRYYMVAKLLVGIYKPAIFFHEHVPSFKVDAFTKFLFSKVNAYVAVQDEMRKWAVKNNMVNDKNAYYLPNTVIAPITEIEIQENSYKILMVGNYREQKNQLFAVSLLAKLPEHYTIDIYGMIDSEEYYESLKKHINNLGLNTRVQLIKGVTNIYEIIGNYSFALHTSLHETGPLVLVEYLYAGLPFITYNTGDVVEVIKEELPLFIIPNFENDSWIKAIQNLELKRKEINLKPIMQKVTHTNFSAEAYFSKLTFIYKKLLA